MKYRNEVEAIIRDVAHAAGVAVNRVPGRDRDTFICEDIDAIGFEFVTTSGPRRSARGAIDWEALYATPGPEMLELVRREAQNVVDQLGLE